MQVVPAGRTAAFNAAKRDVGLSRSVQPKVVRRVSLKENGKVVMGSNGRPVMTREYDFVLPNGSKITIQEHSIGHSYGAPGGVGDQTPHFNIRPFGEPHGKVPGTQEHYYFGR